MLKEKFEFAGINGNVIEGIEKTYENVYDNDTELIFDQKKLRTHEEEGLTFNYYYSVNVIDMYEATGDEGMEGKMTIELNLVLHHSSFSNDRLKKIINSVGVDSSNDLMTSDYNSEGSVVRIGYEDFPLEEHEDFDTVISEKVRDAFCAAESIDGMRGFFLDKPWNRIGTCGWDTIQYYMGIREKLFNF